METYAALLNLRVIVPSSSTSYVGVERNYWKTIMVEHIMKIDLDESWYAEQYPDVSMTIENRIIENIRQHYYRFGYFEHRMPHQIDVEAEWYMSQYPDVRDAVTKGVFASAQAHFEQNGFQEGRHPYPGFSLRNSTQSTSHE